MSLIRLEVESRTIQKPTNVSVKSVAKSGLLSQTGHEAVAIIVKRSQNPRARLFWIVYDCRGNWIHNHFSCTHSPLSQSVFKALGFEKIIPKVSIRNQNFATYWNLGAEGNMKCGVFATEERAAHCQLQIAMKVHKVPRKWNWMVRKKWLQIALKVHKVPKKWKWNWIFKEEKWEYIASQGPEKVKLNS